MRLDGPDIRSRYGTHEEAKEHMIRVTERGCTHYAVAHHTAFAPTLYFCNHCDPRRD